MKSLKRYKLPLIITAFVAVCFVSSGAILYSGNNQVNAGVTTCTWTGGGGSANKNFSDAANWSCTSGTVPADGAALVFPIGVANRAANDDISGSVTYSGISFTGSCTTGTQNSSGYTITSVMGGSTSPIRLAGDIDDNTTNSSGSGFGTCIGNTTISDLTLYSNATFNSAASINIATLNLSTFNFTFSGTNNFNPTISALITGSGQLNVVGADLDIYALTATQSSGFSGSVNLSGGATLEMDGGEGGSTFSLGTAHLNIGDSSRMFYYEPTTATNAITITNPITISGTAAMTYNFSLGTARLGVVFATTTSDPSTVLTNGYTSFGFDKVASKTAVFSGAITLQSNLTVSSNAQVTFTGAISGSSYGITQYTDSTNDTYQGGGSLILNGSSNNSTTPNTTYTPTLETTTITGSTCGSYGTTVGLSIGYLSDVLVDGTCGSILLRNGGVLGGTGTVGNVTSQGGVVAPGDDPGIINTSNFSLDSTSTLDEAIGGTTAGSYDQVNVTGTVTLGGATLNTTFWNGFEPSLNDVYTIINNDGSDAVSGTFAGLAQGATFTVGDVTFTISYTGGTGNDVTLTATTVPGPPDTAGVFAHPLSILLPVGILAVAAGSLVIRHRYLAKLKATRD